MFPTLVNARKIIARQKDRAGAKFLKIMLIGCGETRDGILEKDPRHYLHLHLWFVALSFFLLNSMVFAGSEKPYEVTFEGVPDNKLLEEMKALSDTIALKHEHPATFSLFKKRIERDIKKFLQLLKANGYYGAQVKGEIDSKAEPLRIVFQVDLGPVYVLNSADFQILTQAEKQAVDLPEPSEIGLVLGCPFNAKAVIDAQKALLRELRIQGFPFPKVQERQIVVDHATKLVTVSFLIDPGPQASFGPTSFKGLEMVREAFLRRKIPWKEGDRFNANLLVDLQKRLMDLGLFATIRIVEAPSLDEKGQLPIIVTVTERKHRSIRAGASYKTDEGLGGKLSWEHRNLLRQGERLTLTGIASGITLSAEGVFRKPDFLRNDQALRLSLRLAEDDTDAYTSRNVVSLASIDRNLTKEVSVGAGLRFKTSKVTQLGQEESYSLLSFPLYVERDTSNDLLDPSRGARLALRLSPFYDASGESADFARGYGRYRHYLQLLKAPSLVVATGITLGSIVGAETREIPADERFYAGGGGSIRGYAYQSVGPRIGDVPVGGRSLAELSFELRLRISERFGLVGFLDGGNAYSDRFPDVGEKLYWGAGGGLRYYTPIGPLRLDIGFPLDRRPDIDDSLQIYVSIGQAF
jgi:translocation and assembly module TamA